MQHESNKVVVKQGTLLPQKASSSITGVKNDEKKCVHILYILIQGQDIIV